MGYWPRPDERWNTKFCMDMLKMHSPFRISSQFQLCPTQSQSPNRGIRFHVHVWYFIAHIFEHMENGLCMHCLRLCWAYLSIYCGHIHVGCSFSCHIFARLCIQYTFSISIVHCTAEALWKNAQILRFGGFHFDLYSHMTYFFSFKITSTSLIVVIIIEWNRFVNDKILQLFYSLFKKKLK